MVPRAILLVALVSLPFTGTLRAGDASILSGSKLETKDALKNSDVVFVGEVTQLRKGDWWVTPNNGYDVVGTDVRALQALRGSVEGRIVLMITINGNVHEEPPGPVKRYIFFAHDNKGIFGGGSPIYPGGNRYGINKFLPATDDNIAAVKKLISN